MRAPIIASVALLVGGCMTTPTSSEEHREAVLQYVGHDVGTVGPFSKGGTRELEGLSEKDRKAAAEMLAHGAQGFLVIEPNPNVPNRIVLLSGRKIIGDFPVPKKKA